MTTATPRLNDGEAVVWAGRADSVPWFLPADILLTAFLLAWTAAAAGGVVAAARQGLGQLAVPLVFVCVGSYLLVGRLFVRHRRWQRAEYTLTSDRLVVAVGGQELSAWLDQLPPPVLIGRRAAGQVGDDRMAAGGCQRRAYCAPAPGPGRVPRRRRVAGSHRPGRGAGT